MIIDIVHMDNVLKSCQTKEQKDVTTTWIKSILGKKSYKELNEIIKLSKLYLSEDMITLIEKELELYNERGR